MAALLEGAVAAGGVKVGELEEAVVVAVAAVAVAPGEKTPPPKMCREAATWTTQR